MANLGDWAKFLLAILPLINMMVGLIERLFPSLPGAEKKAMAMDVAKFIIPASSGPLLLSDDVLSTVIDNQVAFLNSAGVFNHGGLTKEGEYPAF